MENQEWYSIVVSGPWAIQVPCWKPGRFFEEGLSLPLMEKTKNRPKNPLAC